MALSRVQINVPVSELEQYRDKGIKVPEFVELKPIVQDVQECTIYKFSDKLFAIKYKGSIEPVFLSIEMDDRGNNYIDILPILKSMGMISKDE